MDDAEYLFYKDSADKKRIGHSAAKKKCGSKSKKCSFPSDYLTRKEKKALSGQVVSYNMREFYSYERFKLMPTDIQIEYLRRKMTDFNVSLEVLSSDMFGMGKTALRQYLRSKGIVDKVVKGITYKRNGRLYLLQAMKENDYQKTLPAAVPEPVKSEENDISEETESKTEEESKPVKTELGACSIQLKSFDLEFISFLASMYRGKEVEISISVFPKENGLRGAIPVTPVNCI